MIEAPRSSAEGLRVRDVLEWPGFPVDLVAGAGGVDRRVRWAHPSELVDPSRFLRGGEIVLTVGMELGTARACEEFVTALLARDAAAVGLAVGVLVRAPDPALWALADAHDLPLFTVPPTLPFVAFTETLAGLQARHLDRVRRRGEDGRLLDFVRRDLASPLVLADRLGADPGVRLYAALTVGAATPLPVCEPAVVGSLDGVVTVVTEATAALELRDALPDAASGWGDARRLADLPRTLKESVAAYRMSLGTGSPGTPRGLASFAGLLARLTPDQLSPFRDQVWAPLRRHDLRHGTRLAETLERFLERDGNLAHTARDMFLHVNTVRHRLRRVRDVTGLDPLAFDDRVALAIGARTATA
jgi:hypothetical protein